MSEKEKERKQRSDSSSTPGAHASTTLSVDERRRQAEDRKSGGSKGRRSKGDEERDAKLKGKAGSGGNASVGAHSSSNPSPSAGGKSTVPDHPNLQTAPLDENYTVEATAVNDDEADERVRKLEEQMAAMMPNTTGTTTTTVPVVAAATPANVNGGGSDDEESEAEQERTFFQKYKFLILFALVAVIAGAVVGYRYSQTSSDGDEASALKYQPPSEAACARLLTDTVVETEFVVQVDVTVEIILVQPKSQPAMERGLTAVDDAVRERLIPFLIGCPVTSNRRRRRLSETDDPLRYMIADAIGGNAIFFDDEEEEMCDPGKPLSCFRAYYEVDFYLKGDESPYALMQLVNRLFVERGIEVLALPSDIISSIRITDTKLITTFTEPPVQMTPAPTPVPGPTQPPLVTSARRDRVQSLVSDFGPIQPAALEWISEVDTWQPENGSANESQQWIERYAVLVFYYATNGVDWSTSTGWLDTSKSVCDGWIGIDYCENDLIVELNFQSLGLNGTLPSEISLLSELASFLAGSNSGLVGQIPVQIGSLSKLEVVDLSETSLSGSIPTEIGKLNLLNFLGIASTDLGGTLPSEIGLLNRVTVLDAFENNLVGTIPTEIGLMGALEQLLLYTNDLTSSIPTEIARLNSLWDLALYTNDLSGTIPTEIGNLRNLEVFQLEGNNRLAGTIPTEVGLLQRMWTLVLYETNIGGSIPTEIGQALSLEILYLSRTGLLGAIPSTIGNLEFLQEFQAFETNLSGSIPWELGSATSLISLELDNNDLTGTIPEEIVDLQNLQTLRLYDNSLTGDVPQLPSLLSGPENCRLDVNCFSNLVNAVASGCNVNSNCAGSLSELKVLTVSRQRPKRHSRGNH